MILHHSGFPIRRSPDRCLFTAPRGLSQLVTSFIGSWCQGIHLTLFFAWTSQRIFQFSLLGSRSVLNCLSFVNKYLLGFLFALKKLPFSLHWIFSPLGEIVLTHFSWKDLSNLFFKIKSVLFLSVRFTLQYTLFGFQWTYSVKPLGFTGRPGWTRTIDLTLIRRAL